MPVAEQHRAEQRHRHAHHGRHVAHHRGDQGDEGRRDGEIQAQVFKAGNAAAEHNARQGEQVPGDVERQAHAQGVPAVELLFVVLAGQGEQLIGEQEPQPCTPAPRQWRNHRAHAHPVEQMLGSQQQRGQQDRKNPGTTLEHADGHQLRRTGKHNARQALALQGREVGFDGHGTGQQAPGRGGQGQRHDRRCAAQKGTARHG
ncbi:hypothetical protein D3C86_1383720 [compost metagenome]